MIWTNIPPLLQWSLETTLAVSVLIALIMLIRKPFAKQFGSQATYLLWLLPLVRVVMPPIPQNWSLTAWLGSYTNQLAEGFQINAVKASELSFAKTITTSSIDQVTLANLPKDIPDEFKQTDTSYFNSFWNLFLENFGIVILSIWICGTFIFLFRASLGQRRFIHLIEKTGTIASANTLKTVKKLAENIGMKSIPNVQTSPLCKSPLVTAAKKPIIVLPEDFEINYTSEEQHFALQHELTHLKRRDLWTYQIARLFVATQWFNPVVHWGVRGFRIDQEAACDAHVINQTKGSPLAYGRTLIKAASAGIPCPSKPSASLALAHPLKERLLLLQNCTKENNSSFWGKSAVAFFLVGSLICTGASAKPREVILGAVEEVPYSKPNPHQETRSLLAKKVEHIHCSNGIRVVYKTSPKVEVKATLLGATWDQVELYVKDGVLLAGWDPSSDKTRDQNASLNLFISSPKLKRIDASFGSSFEGDITADELYVDAASGASVSLRGTCSDLRVDASKASIEANNLQCNDVKVDAQSEAAVEVFASEAIEIGASRDSSIHIFGNPDTSEIDQSKDSDITFL